MSERKRFDTLIGDARKVVGKKEIKIEFLKINHSLKNDFNFIDYAKRELSAYAKKGDCLILLSTSGGNFKNKQSLNLIKLAKYCKKNRIYLLSLLGKGGGELKKYSNKYIIIPSNNTGSIQEAHKMILHSVCAFMDHSF